MERYDAVFVGGGIIGLACAWRAVQRGLSVRVLEREQAGCGATDAAAGMLAPEPERPGFSALALRSSELWPDFAAELRDVTGVDAGYTQCGSLVLSFGEPVDESLGGEWLDGEELRALEPGVASECAGGLLLQRDAQVDPRRVVEALASVLGDVVRTNADVVELHEDGVELADGTRVGAERVVLAAGAWSSRRLAKRLPVQPVKGQTVRLRGRVPATRMIRGVGAYIVPRASGETVVGATVEDAGYETTVTAEATETLLRTATRALPAVGELDVVEAVASLRPATPDGGPLIGEWEGLLVAGGHHANGILLTPVTAEAVAALLTGEEPPPETAPFDPRRFE